MNITNNFWNCAKLGLDFAAGSANLAKEAIAFTGTTAVTVLAVDTFAYATEKNSISTRFCNGESTPVVLSVARVISRQVPCENLDVKEDIGNVFYIQALAIPAITVLTYIAALAFQKIENGANHLSQQINTQPESFLVVDNMNVFDNFESNTQNN